MTPNLFYNMISNYLRKKVFKRKVSELPEMTFNQLQCAVALEN